MSPAQSPVAHPVTVTVDGVQLTTRIHPATGHHFIECNRCKTTIQLTITANLLAFNRHRDGGQCEKAARRNNLPFLASWSSKPTLSLNPVAQSSSTRFGSIRAESPTLSHLSSSLSNLHASSPTASLPATPTRSSFIPSIIISAPKEHPCPGLGIPWSAGSIWSTYPYHRHKLDTLGWHPSSFDDAGNTIFLRSDDCRLHVASGNGEPCLSCQGIGHSPQFQNFLERASEVKDHTPWDYLNHEQLLAAMRRMSRELTVLRSKISNYERRFKTLQQTTTDYKRIMMLIANNEIAGLKRLVSAALRRGASAAAIVDKIQQALNGVYKPRSGFTERDFDIAFLVKAIGGPRLLFALHRSHGLAAETTVRERRKIPQLLASIATPSAAEIKSNIKTFLDPSIKPPPVPRSNQILGNILMFDGVALETRCRYCPRRNQIMGLCREHADNVKTEVTDPQVVEDVRTALFNPASDDEKVCFGSDATVVAIGPYAASEHYRPVPLVVSPSDKTEKWEKLKEWVERVLQEYSAHPYGDGTTGKIWAIASDGDSTYRRAKHEICTTTPLDLDSELGIVLSELEGLNLFTSNSGAVWTCDPKHIFKRFATLLRSKTGIMIQDTNVTAVDTINQLALLPDFSLPAAINLLDPDDKQNVPKAVKLIQQLLRIRDLLDATNPAEMQKRHIINFLAHLLGCFVLPFIDVDMSLSDQLRDLSKFAHLAAILQIQHGSSCLTGALYADAQATVKNLYFVVARLKLIDEDIEFHIILEGTDRLENLFSDCRTQDHARNFDIDQLGSKLASATLINAAFERNPDLTRGHRRLNLKDAVGIDHINPSSWKGDVRVGNVDLRAVWNEGRDAANEEMERFFGPSARVNFSEIFSQPDCDLLRPCGKYVGVQSTSDDSRSEEENDSLRANIATSVPAPALPASAAALVPDSVSSSEKTRHVVQDEDFDDEDGLDGEDLEDFLPDTVDGPYPSPSHSEEADHPNTSNSPTPRPEFSKTLEIDGNVYLKGSLVATLSSNRTKKVTIRTLRASGLAVEDLRQRSVFEDLAETSAFDTIPHMKSTDLAAFLAQSDNEIFLAVLQISGFRFQDKEKQMRSVASLEDLGVAERGVVVVGQVIDLLDMGSHRWEWSGRFLPLDLPSEDGRLSKSLYVAEVPSTFVQPIKQRIVEGSVQKVTWALNGEELETTLNALWEALDPANAGYEIISNIQRLPKINNSTVLPYRASSGNKAFFIKDIPTHLAPKPKLDGKAPVCCRICGEMKPLNKMREHVGRHILYAMRGQEEEGLTAEIDIEPCGFCGLDGCLTHLTHRKSGVPVVQSNCEYHYKGMQFKGAAEYKDSSPCTNVPIHCPLCPTSLCGEPRTIWKYNTINHLLVCHSAEDPSQPNRYLAPKIPPQLMIDMFVSQAEERKLGIPTGATKLYRSENSLIHSDGFEEEMKAAEAEERKKRERAATMSREQPKGKKRKK